MDVWRHWHWNLRIRQSSQPRCWLTWPPPVHQTWSLRLCTLSTTTGKKWYVRGALYSICKMLWELTWTFTSKHPLYRSYEHTVNVYHLAPIKQSLVYNSIHTFTPHLEPFVLIQMADPTIGREIWDWWQESHPKNTVNMKRKRREQVGSYTYGHIFKRTDYMYTYTRAKKYKHTLDTHVSTHTCTAWNLCVACVCACMYM